MGEAVFVVPGKHPAELRDALARVAPPSLEATLVPMGPSTRVDVVASAAQLDDLRRALDGVALPPPLGTPLAMPSPTPSLLAQPRPAGEVGGIDDRTGVTVPVARRRRVLRLDDGSEVELRGTTLLGRDPVPVDPGHADAALVPVHDEARTVSKTHAELTVRDGHVWVRDLGSTNGTEVVGADGTIRPVPTDRSAPVQVGELLRFGKLTATLGVR